MIFYEAQRSFGSNYIYHQFDNGLNFPTHLHKSFEFVYVESGELILITSTGSHSITAGRAALVLPGELHSFHTPKESTSYVCVFSEDFVRDFTAAVTGRSAEDPVFAFENPEAIALLNTPGISVFRQKEVIYSFVGQFYEKCRLTESGLGGDTLFTDLITYVTQHFTEDISLATASHALGRHYNYLSSYINQKAKISFNELLSFYRVDYAKDLLKTTDRSIGEIALQCGFSSIRTFNRCFSGLTGCTPRDFRKEDGI